MYQVIWDKYGTRIYNSLDTTLHYAPWDQVPTWADWQEWVKKLGFVVVGDVQQAPPQPGDRKPTVWAEARRISPAH